MTQWRWLALPGLLFGLVFGLNCDDRGSFLLFGDGGAGTGAGLGGGTGTGGLGGGGVPVGGAGQSGQGGQAGKGGNQTGGATGGAGTSGTAGSPGTAGTSGTAGSPGTAGSGGVGTGGVTGAGGATGTGGISGTGGVGGASASCPVSPSQCSDGQDNDSDGKIDGADPECVGLCDNDEGSFSTGIPGDNVDACKQDCFFDGNSGQGDDGCNWDLRCDKASPGANAEKACPYDPQYKNCPDQQTERCIKNCRKLTPNGCDCFGCCAVTANNMTVTVLLVPTCKASLFGDANACPRCTQQSSCINTCERCEICLGKPTPEAGCILPPPGTVIPPQSGTGGTGGAGGTAGSGGASGAGGAGGTGGAGGSGNEYPCAPGVTFCGTSACSGGAQCISGCCVIP